MWRACHSFLRSLLLWASYSLCASSAFKATSCDLFGINSQLGPIMACLSFTIDHNSIYIYIYICVCWFMFGSRIAVVILFQASEGDNAFRALKLVCRDVAAHCLLVALLQHSFFNDHFKVCHIEPFPAFDKVRKAG